MSVKTFILKSVLFLILLFSVQAVLDRLIFNRVTLPGKLDSKLKTDMDILFFGDSVNTYAPTSETDRRSIDMMLGDLQPGNKMATVSFPSNNLDIFFEYCQHIEKQKRMPKLLIFGINMRSFSPSWDRRPHYEHADQVMLLNKNPLYLFYRPLSVLQFNFNRISKKEFYNTPVFNGTREIGKVKDFEKLEGISDEERRKVLEYYYMYLLTEKHRKVQSLIKILDLLKRNNTRSLFYFTPIDYETGESLLPHEFMTRLTYNKKVIISIIEEKPAHLLDLSVSLKRECFSWGKWPNEHLNSSGRLYVAERLAETVKSLLERRE